MATSRGRVITFYSYKGGTGRSMALANVACLLSRQAEATRGVLAIDWDLEAPGLHHFFRGALPPFRRSVPESASIENKGVIELFQHFDQAIRKNRSKKPLAEEAADEIVRQIAFSDYTLEAVVPKVDLMQAGYFDKNYAERVTAFEWRRFFDSAPTLMRLFAERLTELYDYVLIDSRTGLNDISGICTALLPDQLVLVFTPNRQSLLDGIGAVRKATVYRKQSDDLRPLAVFPLPSRIDVSEPELLEKWRYGNPNDGDDREGYQRRFEDLLTETYGLPSCDLRGYFDEVQIQHVPRYSYGEEIAALVERDNRLSLSRSFAAFADILAKAKSPWDIQSSGKGTAMKIQAVKDYLADERHKLKLHDLVGQEIREVLSKTGENRFTVQGPWSRDEFVVRLHRYEEICADLLRIEALLGFWGEATQRSLLILGPKRLTDPLAPTGGNTGWLALRWYPATLLLYAGGVAAIASKQYENLRELMGVSVSHPYMFSTSERTLGDSVGRAMNEFNEEFKSLPGHERQYTPRSEYLYRFLQPILDDLLFLSGDYDSAFDRFEVFYALEYAERHMTENNDRVWGPIGKFGWKRGDPSNPFAQVVAEAEAGGASWPPLQAGLFGGSIGRFRDVTAGFKELLARLPWY
jgi:Mrp family chromosome partitioning ATPase